MLLLKQTLEVGLISSGPANMGKEHSGGSAALSSKPRPATQMRLVSFSATRKQRICQSGD